MAAAFNWGRSPGVGPAGAAAFDWVGSSGPR